jgi:ATP/maltotriose-dependent transcriptional regulator MalT
VSKAVEDPLSEAQRALDAGEWEHARERFEAALEGADAGTRAEALDGLGWTGWWLADPALTFESREGAFRAYREAGRPADAGRIAALLAADHREFRAEPAVGRGWLERSRALLDGLEPGGDLGMLLLIEADFELLFGEPLDAVATCEQAIELGRRLDVPDLEAIGLAQLGTAQVSLGDVDAGLRSLDAALAIATSEKLDFPFTLAWSICCMISACEKVGDFQRATEWCERAREFVERWGGRQLLGVCRSSYGTVLATYGDWTAAEGELTAAVDDLEAARPGMAPGSVTRLAQLRLRQGRIDEVRELLERAGPAGVLGRAELALSEDDPDTAAELAARALRRMPEPAPLTRFPALELLIRAETLRGRAGDADAAIEELERAAEGVGTPYAQARVRLSRGRVEHAAGRLDPAREAFEDAVDCFEEAAAPYDAAIARLELALTLAAVGRGERAEAERGRAREVFVKLGAVVDIARAERPLLAPAAAGEPEGDGSAELTARELEILRLVASGMNDAEIAERLVLSPHTVHRHVANVRAKLGLGSRAAAVAHASRAGLI